MIVKLLRHGDLLGGVQLLRPTTLPPTCSRRSKPRLGSAPGSTPVQTPPVPRRYGRRACHRMSSYRSARRDSEADLFLIKGGHQLDEIGQRAPQAIEPPDDQRIPHPAVIEGVTQSGSLGFRSTHGVSEDAIAAGGVQRISLQRQVLITSRNARIAKVYTDIVSKVSVDCKKQNGDFETRLCEFRFVRNDGRKGRCDELSLHCRSRAQIVGSKTVPERSQRGTNFLTRSEITCPRSRSTDERISLDVSPRLRNDVPAVTLVAGRSELVEFRKSLHPLIGTLPPQTSRSNVVRTA